MRFKHTSLKIIRQIPWICLLLFVGLGPIWANEPGLPPKPALSPAMRKAVKEVFEKHVQQQEGEPEHIPGAGSAYYRGDGRLSVIFDGYSNPTEETQKLARLFGPGNPTYLKIKPGTKIKRDSIFEINSITKTYTAALTLRLSELDRLDLSTRLYELLGLVLDVKGANCTTSCATCCPTLKEVLGMISGIPDIDDNFCTPPEFCNEFKEKWDSGEDDPTPMEAHRLLRSGSYPPVRYDQFWQYPFIYDFLNTVSPLSAPGAEYHYSSSNFVLTGLVLLEINNFYNLATLYKELSHEMKLMDTYLGAYEPFIENRRVLGWNQGEPQVYRRSFVTTYWAGGGLISSPENVAIWIYKLLQPGAVLKPETLEQMVDFREIKPFYLNSKVPEVKIDGYGLGIGRFSVELNDRTVEMIGHPGLSSSTVTIAVYWPEKDLSFSLFINRRNTRAFTEFFLDLAEVLDDMPDVKKAN